MDSNWTDVRFRSIRGLLLAGQVNPITAISKVIHDLGRALDAASSSTSSDELFSKLELLEALLKLMDKVDHDTTNEVSFSCTVVAENPAEYDALQTQIFDEICLKLFTLISTGIQNPANGNAVLQKHLSRLLWHAFPKVTINKQEALLTMCLNIFKDYVKERKLAFGDGAETAANIQCAMKTLDCALCIPCLQKETRHELVMERIFNTVLQIISVADSSIAGSVIGLLLPKLLKKDDSQLRRQLQELWGVAIGVFEQHGQKTFCCQTLIELSERPSLLLCGLADLLFPVAGFKIASLDLFADFRFWTLLQACLFSQSLLTRKRGMYMLKRILDIAESQNQAINANGKGTALFWWEPNERAALFKLWQDMILLLETLEEKQIHVMKPVLHRLQNLIKGTVGRPNGLPYLHTSWLTSIFQRCALHESAYIKRWSVAQLLDVDLTLCPLLEQQQEFLCSTFVSILTESTIYYKPTAVALGSCPPLATALQKFFQAAVRALSPDDGCQFFNRFLSALCREYWSGAALVYVVQGLTGACPAPAFDSAALARVRELISMCATNVNTYFREAIQCLLMKSVMNLMDGSKVTPAEFAALLGTLTYGQTIQRGCTLWLELVEWLRRIIQDSSHSLWTGASIEKYLDDFLCDWMRPAAGTSTETGVTDASLDKDSCLPAVRLLLLAADANVVADKSTHSNMSVLERHLEPVASTLCSIGTHAYMSTTKANMALTYWLVVMVECGGEVDEAGTASDGARVHVYDISTRCLSEVLMYFQRQIEDISHVSEIPSIQLYTEFLHEVCRLHVGGSQCLELLDSLSPVVSTSKVIAERDTQPLTLRGQLQRLSSILMLATVCDIHSQHLQFIPGFCANMMHFLEGWKVELELERPLGTDPFVSSRKEKKACDGVMTWGRLSSEYIAAQWHCVRYRLLVDEKVQASATYLDRCLEALDVSGGMTIMPVVECLLIMLPHVAATSLPSLLKVVWGKVKEEAKSFTFWPTYELFIKIAYHRTILNGVPDMLPVLMQFAETILEMGEEKTGLVNVLVKQLISCWSVDNLDLVTGMIDIVTRALAFGPMHSRGKRFMHEVHCYLDGLGHKLSVNELGSPMAKADSVVRVHMLNWLSQLQPSIPQHVNFVRQLVDQLMNMQRKLLIAPAYRNFQNCLSHRQKHRVFSALLVLDHFFTEDWNEVPQFLFEILGQECQVSVRCQVEWLLIRLIHRQPQHLHTIWEHFRQNPEKKSACLCSLLSVLAHVSKLPMAKTQQEEFFSVSIPLVLPWCMDHQFNKRVFGQAALLTMWSACKDNQLRAVMDRNNLVDSFVSFTQQNKSAAKKTKQLMETFFFKFDPLEDFSIETICHTLPYLTEVADDEWIHPDRFLVEGASWHQPGTHALPLYNQRQQLKQCSPGIWKVKVPEFEENEISEGDVQKKLVPWRAMMPEEELELDLQEDYSKKRRNIGGLILVASLIDKIPNLGGLCRTCEIFGVSEYIISNLRYVHDKFFQSLSVTAEKWIPIKEVNPHHLKTYLVQMKEEGYTLVGAEQTANSHCLTEYRFPKRTLLLLGNEKEGIPVEVIQLLDACVEIPQQGVIRSLNVHVSGAMLIWEYARQQLHAQQRDGSSSQVDSETSVGMN